MRFTISVAATTLARGSHATEHALSFELDTRLVGAQVVGDGQSKDPPRSASHSSLALLQWQPALHAQARMIVEKLDRGSMQSHDCCHETQT